ncbi:hypothetical protein [Undibacterium flavidum]|uniref:Uncharacterized protein n=1 Tax=Undibacterium flavidum TaxID=2762297 RepID=A0ABR6YEA5_9BURK|nr:hypothetical protein [Undibacterium flavidum]MBC3874904.1 hypothetical protein [Undibacterium flavidum]
MYKRLQSILQTKLFLKLTKLVILIGLTSAITFYFSAREPKKIEEFNVLIFDTKIKLPSDYYLLVPNGKEEIQLPGGKNSQILVGGKIKEEFLSYLKKNMKTNESKCGLSIMSGGEDVKWKILYSEINYIFFAGAESIQAANPVLEEVCENIKNGIVWHSKK